MPLRDASAIGSPTFSSDVCVIGGGPAGIAVASALADSDRDVVVLEAGGPFTDRTDRRNATHAIRDHVRGAQSAAKGRNTGEPYYPLRLSRARGVGGSSAALKSHGLRSRPFDPIDFAPAWGSSSWPIDFAEYAAFLPEAQALCGLTVETDWPEPAPSALALGDRVSDVEFRHGPRDAFAQVAEELVQRGQTWVLHAVATSLLVDGTGHVTAVGGVSSDGSAFTMDVGQVVLATGGIDNARFLLNSASVLEAMGPAADHVGRTFMEHLHYTAGHLIPTDEDAYQRIYDVYCDINEERWIAPSDAQTREAGLARSAFVPIPGNRSSVTPGVRAFGRVVRTFPYGPFDRSLWTRNLADMWSDKADVAGAVRERVSGSSGYDSFVLGAMSEQVPNAESTVSLGDRTDRYGLRLPELHWDLTELDLDSARASAEVVGRAFEQAGLAEYVPVWADDRQPVFEGGWHHMGTTRMALDPADGVVDTDARVFGVNNLYVAGSSVFPTGGFANPTLSIVALGLRLGEHLAER